MEVGKRIAFLAFGSAMKIRNDNLLLKWKTTTAKGQPAEEFDRFPIVFICLCLRLIVRCQCLKLKCLLEF